ncbi:hypothetical protein [uncultured Gimesia sp.]|uniref:hypothetical protein n=1 Tax=uncultured Gimesia sp. TaxID=1678688 RepID=UPI0030DDA641|tara:strand:+ start:259940 stop:260434 length:495 start_codon:yes stop_codon:yes gene_type:complete
MTFLRAAQLRFILLAGCLMITSGCGSSAKEPEILSKLVPVTGSVTLDGEPVPSVLVTYLPEAGATGAELAFGFTDETGKYNLRTPVSGYSPEKSQGAVPANYRVYITKLVMPDGSPIEGEISDAEAEEKGARQLLPPRYSSPTATKLKATVNPTATNNDLELTK